MHRRRSTALALAAGVSVLLAAAGAGAQQGPKLHFQPSLTQAGKSSLHRPYALGVRDVPMPRPFWAEDGVYAAKPQSLRGLGKAHRASPATFDPDSKAWYAAADGALVRVDPDGSLPVLTDDVQGLDLDVRARRGRAVSREPDDRIVLHSWQGRESQKKVLLAGQSFFNPRFSHDGSRVLVAQSRAAGGHMWLVDVLSGAATDLGQGYDASWHPDGKRIYFVRIEHDGEVITASTLYVLDLKERKETKLSRTEGPEAPIFPEVSPDGRWLAFAAARGGEAFVVPLPGADAGEGR